MTPAERIIARFGGPTALARALGHKYPTTVSGWLSRKRIPAWQQDAVLRAARQLNVNVHPEDFFRVEDRTS